MEVKAETDNNRKITNGGKRMTIEKAISLSTEEFEALDREYSGFNKDRYSNHQVTDGEESFYDFLEKGCENIENMRIF